MKLFLSHAVYNGTEICYRDFKQKVKIELLKEKLVNNPPQTQEKRHCLTGVVVYLQTHKDPRRRLRYLTPGVLNVCTKYACRYV